MEQIATTVTSALSKQKHRSQAKDTPDKHEVDNLRMSERLHQDEMLTICSCSDGSRCLGQIFSSVNISIR